MAIASKNYYKKEDGSYSRKDDSYSHKENSLRRRRRRWFLQSQRITKMGDGFAALRERARPAYRVRRKCPRFQTKHTVDVVDVVDVIV